VRGQRASYDCGRGRQRFLPEDDALGLVDEIRPGLMPLVCLAGALAPFGDAAQDVLQRCAGGRVSASTGLRCTEGNGERLRAQQQDGRRVRPPQAAPQWTVPRAAGPPAADVGLDAFRVPLPGPGASKAEPRLRSTALLDTPAKGHTRELVDCERDALAEHVRGPARVRGVKHVSDLMAVTDGGNGLGEALPRHLAEDLTTILDWYQAAAPVGDFARAWHARDEAARAQGLHEAKGLLDEQGGEALRAYVRALAVPPRTAAVRAALRQLLGSFANNRHRTDYPTDRQQGWDIGRGPTEAGCTIIGARLKGSGLRWVEGGAATVAALRALDVSGGQVWDGFWAPPHRPAA
jgi:hypothetical protein